MSKIAIIMAYYNRVRQLRSTLNSIKSEITDYDIVIFDDASDYELKYDVPHVHIIHQNEFTKRWTNPEPAYNSALLYAIKYLNPEIIILQNPECMHVGDILKYAVDNLTDENYLSFGCYSIDKGTYGRGWDGKTMDRSVSSDMGLGWYNHSQHRPVAYDFCSAITTKNIIRINGYDERFSNGCAYGDNYLLHRIRNLGLKVEIVDSPFVVHQWHENSTPKGNGPELISRNNLLWQDLRRTNDFKAVHIYTDNL